MREFRLRNLERERERGRRRYKQHAAEHIADTSGRQARKWREEPEKMSQIYKEWQRRNPGKQRIYSMRSQYGLEPEDFERLLASQNNACAICLAPFTTDRTPHVDHDHASNNVRGLLCGSCNRGLGLFGDNPDSLKRAAEYVAVKRVLSIVRDKEKQSG